MKALGTILASICVATVLTQALALGYLAVNGQLNSQTLAGVRDVLSGNSPGDSTSDDDTEKVVPPSIDDVVDKRIGRVWDLDRRQKELAILKTIITNRKDSVTSRQDKFSKLRETLLAELEAKEKTLQDAATEKARTILIKMPPADAVANLMALDLDRNVVLLKGMPERNVAELLQEFGRENDKVKQERGRQIFDAISRGEPQQSTLQKGLRQIPAKPKAKPKANPKTPAGG